MQYGLIGEKLGHSYSREIHALIGGYDYELCEIAPEKLGAFLTKRDFRAINVTIPYKQAVIPYLDGISDAARSIGAVNTIVNTDGKLFGYNTDFAGMEALIRRLGIELHGKKVLIPGSGGTSKTAAALAAKLGAREILRLSRNAAVGTVSYEEAYRRHTDAEIVINATPCGMFPNPDAQAIHLEPFTNLAGLVDAVYNPLRTNLVLAAQKKNIPAEGGLYMLAAQAVYASALFLGMVADESDIERAYRAVYSDKRNIALIGMPSSGKTSVGRLLAAALQKEFCDSDEVVINRIGMPIADYFAKCGEAAFRKCEKEVLSELTRTGGKVIATGGGAILDEDNVRALRRTGTVIFLDRSLDRLTATPDRPLSSDTAALKRLFSDRYDKYIAAADIHVNADGELNETVEIIIKELKK